MLFRKKKTPANNPVNPLNLMIDDQGRTQHSYICGQLGTGSVQFIQQAIEAMVQKSYGALLDLEYVFAADLLKSIPKIQQVTGKKFHLFDLKDLSTDSPYRYDPFYGKNLEQCASIFFSVLRPKGVNAGADHYAAQAYVWTNVILEMHFALHPTLAFKHLVGYFCEEDKFPELFHQYKELELGTPQYQAVMEKAGQLFEGNDLKYDSESFKKHLAGLSGKVASLRTTYGHLLEDGEQNVNKPRLVLEDILKNQDVIYIASTHSTSKDIELLRELLVGDMKATLSKVQSGQPLEKPFGFFLKDSSVFAGDYVSRLLETSRYMNIAVSIHFDKHKINSRHTMAQVVQGNAHNHIFFPEVVIPEVMGLTPEQWALKNSLKLGQCLVVTPDGHKVEKPF